MRRLAELEHEATSYGIKIPPPGCFTKSDLMDLLAEYYREHGEYPNPLLPQLDVMLARNAKDLKDFDVVLANKGGLWIAEEKLDGVRAKLHLGATYNRIDSRHRSDITYEYVEKTDCLPHLRNLTNWSNGTVLDGELIMPVETISEGKTDTDSYLTSTTATVNSKPGRAIELQEKVGYCNYHVFDILFHRGEDVRDYPYSHRYELARAVCTQLIEKSSNIKMPTRCYGRAFRNFFTTLVAGGGEGIMLKRLDWTYDSGKRSKGMYKLKKQAGMDCFITGFVPGEGEFSGLVGALCVSVMAVGGTPREVAAIQPGDYAFRKRISLACGSLSDEWYGKVVEVTYLCKTKNNRLRHAVLKRFRPDKTMHDCTGE